MIKLALEMPTMYLHRWGPKTDVDFALAHKVLADEAYAEYFAHRSAGRELILDNSVHELGHPLPVTDLATAAALVRADYVVAPDQLGQYEQNLLWFTETQLALGDRYKIAVTLCGHNAARRLTFLQSVASHASMLCLPFREPRLVWYIEQRATITMFFSRVHLFGVSTLDELQTFARCADDDGWSVDTCKPIKWGIQRKSLTQLPSLHGGDVSTKDLLEIADLDEEQLFFADANIDVLRRYCDV